MDPEAEAAMNTEALQKSLTSLTPALDILERFHHRNKNQHRVAKWWVHADILRRHLRKTVISLDARLSEVEKTSKTALTKTALKKKKAALKKGKKEDDEITVRASYLRGKLVPGAYM